MKKYMFFCILGMSLSLGQLAVADPAPTTAAPSGQIPLMPQTSLPVLVNNHAVTAPIPPKLTAKGAILIDAYSGKVLSEVNANQRMAPASLTKIMTAYIVSEAIRSGRLHMDDKVHISEKAWRMGGSKMFVKVGSEVSVHDLLQGVIVDSGNDASVALAEHLAGSEEAFVELMNQQAQLLGMTGTHYTDATGMPNADHYTTPQDIAILARALVFNYPEDYQWYSQKWFTFNNIKQPNRNRLLWRDNAVDGIKTGHTDQAGFCLVASAQKNNTRLIAVVMGEPTDKARADDSQKLLNFGFRSFETHPVFTANAPVDKVRVWLGRDKYLPVGTTQNIYITTPTGQYHKATVQVATNEPILKAPIKKDQVVGTVTVTLNNQVIATQPVIALDNMPKGNIFARIKDHTRLTMKHIFGSNEGGVKTS